MNIEKKQIEINPRVIQHLGKDLITSSDVAVVELIKNSIDANAPKIALRLFDSLRRVKHSPNSLTCVPESAFLMIPSFISITAKTSMTGWAAPLPTTKYG